MLQVIFYDDIATAILRMEVLIRLEAMRKRLCDLLRRSAFLKKGLRSGACTISGEKHDEAMTSDVENLMLEHLRAIRADISEIKLKVDELAGSYAGLLKIAASQGDATVRLDRRLERVEQGIELVETYTAHREFAVG